MQELIGITIFIGLIFELYLLGHFTCRYLFKSINEFSALKPAIGLAFVLVLSSFLYSIGIPLRFAGYIYLAISGIYLSIIALRLSKEGFNNPIKLKKGQLWYAFCAIMIFLPPIVGGTNFQVFQGNEADHLSYQSISLSVNKYSYHELTNAAFEDLGRANPTANLGIININKRPIVEIVYVSLLKQLGLSLIDYSYYFLLVLLIISFYSTFGYIQKSKKPQNAFGGVFLSLVLIGFWGQYLFDLNAWSFLLALPIFILLASAIKKIVEDPSPNIIILMIFLIYALFVTYPEAAVFWIFGLSLGLLIILFKKRETLRWRNYRYLGYVPIISGLMIFQFGFGALNFLFGQTGVTTSAVTSSWHLYYDAYLLGNNPNEQFQSINLLRTIPMGLLGLFSITPSHIQINFRTFFLFIVPFVAIFLYSLLMFFKNRKQYLLEPMFYVVITCIIATPIIFQISTLWAIGKLVTFALFPILILYATRNSFLIGTSNILRLLSIFAIVVWSLTQISFAVDRITWSESKAIPHKRLPYISVGDPSLKANQNWKISLAKIRTCNVTAIKVNQPFQNLYLSMKLEDNSSKWVDLNPIATFFGGGAKIGNMKTSFLRYDCLVTNEFNGEKFTFQIKKLNKPIPILMKN